MIDPARLTDTYIRAYKLGVIDWATLRYYVQDIRDRYMKGQAMSDYLTATPLPSAPGILKVTPDGSPTDIMAIVVLDDSPATTHEILSLCEAAELTSHWVKDHNGPPRMVRHDDTMPIDWAQFLESRNCGNDPFSVTS